MRRTSDLLLWRTVQWACCISVPRPLFVNVSTRVCVCVPFLFFLHLLEVFLLLAIFVFSLNELSCSSSFDLFVVFVVSDCRGLVFARFLQFVFSSGFGLPTLWRMLHLKKKH